MEGTNEAKALADIVKWSETCCPWQRDALRRLFSGPISETDVSELAAICRGDHLKPVPLSADLIRDPKAVAKAVSLCSVHGVENVNALALGQRLTFDKAGMTVIYGDNGAGKSGYIRILKKVCRARSPKEDRIEPNIYLAKPGPQRACVKFSVEGQNLEAVWEHSKVVHPALSSVSVFDSRTANVHVDETNNVAYTPLPMKLLEELAQLCRKLRERLIAEIEAIEQQTPATLRHPKCSPATKVGLLITKLSEKTKPAHVSDLAVVTVEEKQRCDALQRDLASNPAIAARSLEMLRTRLRVYVEGIKRLLDAISPERLEALDSLRAQYSAAKQAAAVAAESLFDGEPLSDIGSDVWRMLWESARGYSERLAYINLQFPVTGEEARCVLCQQELSAESKARLLRFEDFVKDESKKREAETLQQLSNALRDLRAVYQTTAPFREAVSFVREELQDANLAAALRRIAGVGRWRLRGILRGAVVEKVAIQPLPEEAIAAHDKLLKDRATALTSESDSEARRALIAQCDELTDRLWLEVVRNDVLAEIERHRQIAALKAALKDTNPLRITMKSAEIAEQLVTNTLRSEFAKEVNRIGMSHLAIELRKGRTTYGTPQFRVALVNKPDAVVGEVLSEGEHRCIAIAAFLAELATTESRSAIVLDDPVSSLDHLHRDNIADRLAEESLHRQVILFTHDIAFLILLNEACRRHKAHIGFRTVARNDDFTGYCHAEPPANARPVGMVIDAMQAQLNNQKIQYEQADRATWERTVKSLQEQLRETWERAVEEAVSPVLYRLGTKVNTPGLAKLTVIDLEDCRKMRDAYGRCSRLLHSVPASLSPRLPKPKQVQDEIDALRNWYFAMRDRQAAVAEV